MSSSAIITRARSGLESPAVTVETQLPGGLPGFTLVGMPETAVREARDRVKSAIQACGFEFPRGRVLVNLAPAELAKEGSRYDLAIAASILCATGQLPYRIARNFEYLGELSLFGELRPARGALCAALATNQAVILAPKDAREALQLGLEQVYPLAHLSQLKQLLKTPQESYRWAALATEKPAAEGEQAAPPTQTNHWDNIVAQPTAKRALLLAAAGGHHLLLIGPPGAGKSLLARCLIDLLPGLTGPEQREVAAIYSASGYPVDFQRRPFREPHHTASSVALAGGGRDASAGEISLAHRGVLFLDELPHFTPSVLDLLREPLSLGRIDIARAHYRVSYPAAFQLIAAMNPCPSGFHCQPERCRCTPTRVRAYQGRISGPLLDRIDLQLAVPAVPAEALLNAPATQDTTSLDATRAIVASAQKRQRERQDCLNALADPRDALEQLTASARTLLLRLAKQQRLSARSQHRLLNVARTLADLDAEDSISERCVGEAFAYRQVDWEGGLGVRAG